MARFSAWLIGYKILLILDSEHSLLKAICFCKSYCQKRCKGKAKGKGSGFKGGATVLKVGGTILRAERANKNF